MCSSSKVVNTSWWNRPSVLSFQQADVGFGGLQMLHNNNIHTQGQ
jgi:hypothetical protein